MSRIWIILLLSAPAFAQTGSISGVIHEAGTGKPMEDVSVFASPGQAGTKTDAHGHYALRDLNPGRYTIHVWADSIYASKVVALGTGQDLSSVDFHLHGASEISGKVLDENKEPLSGMAVFLIAREYSLGTLRYVFTSMG